MELVSYMPVRAFSLHGDIGNINHGLGLNPWLPFLVGTACILAGQYYLYRYTLPRMNMAVAGSSRQVRYVILLFSAFFLFIFRSSSHSALSFSPSLEWATGLFGYAAFIVIICSCRPRMRWVVEAEKKVAGMMDRAK
ncbi:MAG: hypothetical protein ABFC24_07725 [Methanoregulaceae archaeon]